MLTNELQWFRQRVCHCEKVNNEQIRMTLKLKQQNIWPIPNFQIVPFGTKYIKVFFFVILLRPFYGMHFRHKNGKWFLCANFTKCIV